MQVHCYLIFMEAARLSLMCYCIARRGLARVAHPLDVSSWEISLALHLVALSCSEGGLQR